MRPLEALVRLWPGGVPLWRHGAGSGLVLAVGFSLLLNLTLLTTFVWTDVATPAIRTTAWAVVAVLWGSAWWAGRRWSSPAGAAEFVSGTNHLFQLALGEYLRSNWVEAERLARRLIQRHPRDPEPRLLLAGILRRERRWSEAEQELNVLLRLESAHAWRFEIEQERRHLAAAQNATPDTAEPPASEPTTQAA